MQQSYIIGVDIGTGSTKAVALNNRSEVLCSAQHFYAATAEKNEQDAVVAFDAFQQCIKEIVVAMQMPPAGISLSSAMHSIMAVDEGAEPLTKAILWSDTRSNEIAKDLRASSLGEEIYKATGTPLHSMSPLCKIRWLQQHEPLLFSKSAKFISIKEYIWYQLFGEFKIDHSLASATGLFNYHKLQWEEKALSFAGINSRQLSDLVSVTYQKTGFSSAIATALGIPSETPFFIGASDGCLANLGSLCLSPAEAAITIGTSGAVRITSTKPVQNFERMIFNYLLDEKTYICGGAINNGGNVFKWLLKNLFDGHKDVTTYEQLFHSISSVPPGSKGLLFLPYLHGERAPIWDEKSCGTFFGIHAAHNLAFFARAAAEGVCFALYHILSSLEEVCGAVQQITISGGLVNEPVMIQLLANVTGKKVVVQQSEDASALGAALLAQKAMGILEDYFSIPKKEETVYYPNPPVVNLYQDLFKHYKALYPVLKNQMHSLHQFSI